jgi:hypothetical protein
MCLIAQHPSRNDNRGRQPVVMTADQSAAADGD